MNADIRATSIANEVYPMLVEMCGNSGIEITDLIRELHAKQQLIGSRLRTDGRGGVGAVSRRG